MKQNIDNIADQHISELKDVLHKSKTEFEESQAGSNNRKEQLRYLVNENLEVLKSGNNILLFDVVKELKEIKDELPIFPSLPDTKFDPDVLNEKEIIKQAFGSIAILGKNTNGTDDIDSVSGTVTSQSKETIHCSNVETSLQIQGPLAYDDEESKIKPEILTDITDGAAAGSNTEQRKEGEASVNVDVLFDQTDTKHKLLKQPTIVHTSDTRNALARRIVATKNGTIFFIEKESSSLHVMQKNIVPPVITEINLGRSYINDIAVNTIDDEIYCIRRLDKSVCCMDKMTRTPMKLFTAAGKPKCLDFTIDNNIIIGDFSKPLLTIYTHSGNQLRTVKYAGKTPYNLAVCRLTGKVAIVSTGPEVIVLNRDLIELYRYDGPPATYTDPYDANFDMYGHLLIADCDRGIRVINAESGNHLKTIKLPRRNQSYISLLVLDKELILGVGVSKHEDDKIHEPYQLQTMKYIA